MNSAKAVAKTGGNKAWSNVDTLWLNPQGVNTVRQQREGEGDNRKDWGKVHSLQQRQRLLSLSSSTPNPWLCVRKAREGVSWGGLAIFPTCCRRFHPSVSLLILIPCNTYLTRWVMRVVSAAAHKTSRMMVLLGDNKLAKELSLNDRKNTLFTHPAKKSP